MLGSLKCKLLPTLNYQTLPTDAFDKLMVSLLSALILLVYCFILMSVSRRCCRSFSIFQSYDQRRLKSYYNIRQTNINPSDSFINISLPLQRSLGTGFGHECDSSLTFDGQSHTYYYKNEAVPYSVTQIVSNYFEKFEPNRATDRMITGPNWPRAAYQHPNGEPFSKTEILDKWNKDGLNARTRGTLMHEYIENYINGVADEFSDELYREMPELNQFNSFYDNLLVKNNIIPFRTEWRIVAPDLGIAGSIDFIGHDVERNSFVLVDWKRSKDLATSGFMNYNKFGSDEAVSYCRAPMHHLPDCDSTKYSLQLNFYRFILENYYNMTISRMIVASFHPVQEQYYSLDVKDMQHEVEVMITDLCEEGLVDTDSKT